MEAIIKTYVWAFIDAVIIALLIAILLNVSDNKGNKGVYGILQNQVTASIIQDNYTTSKDFETIKNIAKTELPTITIDNSKKIIAGEVVDLNELIYIKDAEGNPLSFKIKKIEDMNKNDITSSCNDDKIVFVTSGIFSLSFTTVDSTNRIQNLNVNIPVLRGGNT